MLALPTKYANTIERNRTLQEKDTKPVARCVSGEVLGVQ
jgi:hypothetical protein